jgi:hypothetical protein
MESVATEGMTPSGLTPDDYSDPMMAEAFAQSGDIPPGATPEGTQQ